MTTQAPAPSVGTRVAVRVNLACGWCGRSVEDVRGERDPVSGRLLLTSGSDVLTISGGRARCAACGGAMFLEDWRPLYQSTAVDPQDFTDEPTEPASSSTAAA